jgi:hypothetical protein
LNELIGAQAWLDSVLKGDATLRGYLARRWWADAAPETDPATLAPPAYPLGIYTLVSTVDRRRLSQRVLTEAVYRVVVIGEGGGIAALQAAASRVDALLNDKSAQAITIGGESFTVGCYREAPYYRPCWENGVRFEHVGGLYRVIIHPA